MAGAKVYRWLSGQWIQLGQGIQVPQAAMWVGAARKNPVTGGTNLADFQAASADIGPLRMRRVFDNSVPPPNNIASANQQAGLDRAAGIVSFLSIKGTPSAYIAGTYDAALDSLARSMADGEYLSMRHEPENDTDLDAATFSAIYQHAYPVLKAARPGLNIGPVYMNYQWRPGSTTTANPDAWDPGPGFRDFLGIDWYYTTTSRATPIQSAATDAWFQRWFTWAKTKGCPLGVAEYGKLPNPTDATDAGKAMLADELYLRANGFAFWLLYDSVGPAGDDWTVDADVNRRNAWRGIASRGRTS